METEKMRHEIVTSNPDADVRFYLSKDGAVMFHHIGIIVLRLFMLSREKLCLIFQEVLR